MKKTKWFQIFRLANLLQCTKLSDDTLWGFIKKIKLETSDNIQCFKDRLYMFHTDKLSQVTAVEKLLESESTEQKYENMTLENLETAAKMFIYLNSCPYNDGYIMKSWSSFYDYLLNTQSVEQIILTLNRMMKIKTTQSDDDGKIRAEKLFKRTATLLSLEFGEIQQSLQLVKGHFDKSDKG